MPLLLLLLFFLFDLKWKHNTSHKCYANEWGTLVDMKIYIQIYIYILWIWICQNHDQHHIIWVWHPWTDTPEKLYRHIHIKYNNIILKLKSAGAAARTTCHIYTVCVWELVWKVSSEWIFSIFFFFVRSILYFYIIERHASFKKKCCLFIGYTWWNWKREKKNTEMPQYWLVKRIRFEWGQL